MPAALACSLIPLAEVTLNDGPRVGAKAVGLARLARAGLPVPLAWCVPVAAYRAHLEEHGLDRAIRSVLASDDDDPKDRRERLADLRRLIIAAPLAADLKTTIARTLDRCQAAPDGVAWAVRSSATAEDLPAQSFAGQYDSFLDATDAAACADRVKRCWASLWSERAFAYRRRHAIDHAVAMAVVIQRRVEADASGVAFTADPVSGRRDAIVIEAGRGLGDDLVAGRVTPDRFVFTRPSLEIAERTLVSAAPCVPDAALRGVAERAIEAEAVFGAPVDVEWAIAGDTIHLVQTRAITTRTAGPDAARTWEDRQVWTNANAGEVVPDVMTPMTESVILPLVDRLFATFGQMVGADFKETPITGMVAGRVYFNLNTLAGFARRIPIVRNRDVADLLGGQHLAGPTLEGVEIPDSDVPRLRVSLWRAAMRLPLLLLGVVTYTPARGSRFVDRAKRVTEERWRSDWPSLSDAALVDRVRRDVEGLVDGPEAFRCLGVAVMYWSALRGVCRRWFGDDGDAAAARLVAGLGSLDSAEAGLALWRLAALARRHPAVATVITAGGTFAEVRAALGKAEGGAEFLARWGAALWQHGHHARGEIELFNARWAECPDYLLDLVRGYLQQKTGADGRAQDDPLDRSARLGRERLELAAQCRRRLRNPLKRAVFTFLLRQAQRGLPIRENLKSDAVRRIALLRRMLLELGARWTKSSRLEDPEDVFFLRLDEFEPALHGDASLDVAATVSMRRAAHEQHLAVTPPPVVHGRFDPDTYVPDAVDTSVATLHGVAVSPGRIAGPARVILRAGTDHVRPGEILVAPFTDPGWTPYFLNASAIVMDLGGILSHGSIVAREYGIPCVVNVGPATLMIRTGQRIEVDGARGTVRIDPAGGDAASNGSRAIVQ